MHTSTQNTKSTTKSNTQTTQQRCWKWLGGYTLWQYGLWSFQAGGTKLERVLPKNNHYDKAIGSSNTQANKIFSPTPYTIFFQLNIYAKLQDDALQIVEQIVPYFNPQYTLTIKPFGEYSDVKEDVPIVLQSVAFMDDFEGAVESRRTIIYTMDFGMKVNFHGPFRGSKIITKAITDVYIDKAAILTSGADSDGLYVKQTTSPNPANASPFSDFGFTIDTDYYGDSSQ